MQEKVVEQKIKNNKDKVLIIIVILLLIASLTLGGYIVYDKLINNKKVENEETNKVIIEDTTKTLVSKEISLLIKQYNLDVILSSYNEALAFDYTKLSKQSIDKNAGNVMIRVMINSALNESFVSDAIHGTGIDIKLTEEENEFRDSVTSSAYMYISDFNKYIKDVFKSDIVIKENDTSFDYSGCPSMHIFKDKIYLTYQCGYTLGPINNIYTSFVKDQNKIYLYGIVFKENEYIFKVTRVKYTFEYNGKIWDLKGIEPLEVIQ